MSSNTVSSQTIRKNTAEATISVELVDNIDLLDLTGPDTSTRPYTSLLSGNNFSTYDSQTQLRRNEADSDLWSTEVIAGSTLGVDKSRSKYTRL